MSFTCNGWLSLLGVRKEEKRAKWSLCVSLGQRVLSWLQICCSIKTDKGQSEFQFVIHLVILWVKSCYLHTNVPWRASHTILVGILLLFSPLSWEVYLLMSQPGHSPVQSKWTYREHKMLPHRVGHPLC